MSTGLMGVALYRSASLLADAGVQFILPNMPAQPQTPLKGKSGLGAAFALRLNSSLTLIRDGHFVLVPRGQCAVSADVVVSGGRTKRDLGGAERSGKLRGGKTRSRSKFSSFLLEEAN